LKHLSLTSVLIFIVFTVSPICAYELSQEDYLKEVNKALSRVYEETSGKTLSAQIAVLESLAIDYKDNDPVLDLLLQERGTAHLRISVYPDSDSGIIRTSVPVSSGQVNSHLA